MQAAQHKLQRREEAWQTAQARLWETQQQLTNWQAEVTRLEAEYQVKERPERPHSRLTQARRRLRVQQHRLPRRQEAVAQAQQRVGKQGQRVEALQAEQAALRQRLTRFEADNATHPAPIQALFRLDAGFGTSENVALLIEMGYEVYTKPYSHRVTAALRGRITAETTWEQVGSNAEMVAWNDTIRKALPACLYVQDHAQEFWVNQVESLRFMCPGEPALVHCLSILPSTVNRKMRHPTLIG